MIFCIVFGLIFTVPAVAHEVAGADAHFVLGVRGPEIGSFLYLGAKHMVTGLDHVLYLLAVIFYLRRASDVVIFVSIFTLGHSLTLLASVLMGWQVNPYIVDAVIGLSVVYKALENLDGFNRLPVAIDPRLAVFGFGLIHGLGLGTKLQSVLVPADGFMINLIAFNVGVECGQLLALALIVLMILSFSELGRVNQITRYTNRVLVVIGICLTTYHITGWWIGDG